MGAQSKPIVCEYAGASVSVLYVCFFACGMVLSAGPSAAGSCEQARLEVNLGRI